MLLFRFHKTSLWRGCGFYMSLCLSILSLFTSCSNDDCNDIYPYPQPGANDQTEVSFDLVIDPGVSTRSGRLLWSRAPRQQVNDLRLYAFKEGEGEALFYTSMSVTEFANFSPSYSQTESVKVRCSLEEGSYTFLAIGYECDYNGSQKIESDTYILPDLQKGKTTLRDMTLSLPSGVDADEVFAGLKTGVSIGPESKLVDGGHIILNRVPAGVLAYFEHIPYQLSDTEGGIHRVMRVTVEMAARGTETFLTAPFNMKEKETGRYDLISFDMSGLEKDGENNWYRIPAYNWSAEGRKEMPKGVNKKSNSVLGGKFVLPFTKVDGEATLRVALYGGEKSDELLTTYDVICTQHTSSQDNNGDLDHDNKVFDILANHYYSLGMKYTDSGEDTDDPDHPEPFYPDKPIDLSKEQVIVVTIDPRWDERHDMTL